MEISLAPAWTLLSLLGGYLALGVPVALAFAAVGAARVDDGVRGPLPLFRLLLLPGALLLWPLILIRWRRAGRAR